jgi:Golgi phosphoprotein 3
VIELAFRGRVSMQKDSSRRRFPLADRVIEVIDDTLTGEVLLDEALKMMKASEKMSVSSWIDLMSGKNLVITLCTTFKERKIDTLSPKQAKHGT